MIKITTILDVMGDSLPFDEITELLGVQPTQTRRREEFPNPTFGIDRWTYQIQAIYPVPQSEDGFAVDCPFPDVMVQLNQIQQAFVGGAERFAEWRRTHPVNVLLDVWIHSDDETVPLMIMPSSFVQFTALIGADVEYIVSVNSPTAVHPTLIEP